MKIEFIPEGHKYKIDGITCPGVTTILDMLPKPWLSAWAAKECAEEVKRIGRERTVTITFPKSVVEDRGRYIAISEEEVDKAKNKWRQKRDRAADQGKIAHSWLERFVKNKMSDVSIGILPLPEEPEARNSVELFLKWESERKPKWLESEVVTGSFAHMFGGKFDCICALEGLGVCLVDFKTSSNIFKNFDYQLAAYQMALLEERPTLRLDNRVILHLPKEGDKHKEKVVESPLGVDWNVFLGCLTLHRALNKAEGWKK